MSRDLLLEIGVEEIPSAYMGRALENLQALAVKRFDESRLSHGDIQVVGTPRRLTLLVPLLGDRQEDAVIENRGPKQAAAFDKEGNPSKAGLGFARGQGIDFSDLKIQDYDGIPYVYAVKTEVGKSAQEILPALLFDLINALSFPRSMRWGYYQTRFARPIRWLLCLYGPEVIPLQVENLVSGRTTYGHRFLSKGPIEIADTVDYFAKLQENYVVLDQNQRRDMIWRQVVQVANAAGGEPMHNEELLEEVNYLVEYPTAFYGEFSPSYLDVPPEVLTTSMIEHQRYFPVFDAAGKLMPGFIGIRNGTDFDLETVKAGNQRVLKARLEDALFFWKEDTKKPLESLAPGLEDVLFHERLGTSMDKVKRVQQLAVFIAETAGLGSTAQVGRAAYLCKADLLSKMVYEFPELQGIMGRYYARLSGEEAQVSEAIFEHYLPRFAGDQLPETPTGIALSLAEKLDNMVGSFALNIKPTGSQDPYALRRQAIGLVSIITERQIQVDLTVLLNQAYLGFSGIALENGQTETSQEVLDFILQRMRGVLLEKGFSYDVIDAVFAVPSGNLNHILARVEALQDLKEQDICADLMVVFNRSNNLSKKWDDSTVDDSVLADDSERILWQKAQAVVTPFQQAVNNGNYQEALTLMAGLRPELDRFFEAVMVMVDDQGLKAARLGILKTIANAFYTLADLTKMVI